MIRYNFIEKNKYHYCGSLFLVHSTEKSDLLEEVKGFVESWFFFINAKERPPFQNLVILRKAIRFNIDIKCLRIWEKVFLCYAENKIVSYKLKTSVNINGSTSALIGVFCSALLLFYFFKDARACTLFEFLSISISFLRIWYFCQRHIYNNAHRKIPSAKKTGEVSSRAESQKIGILQELLWPKKRLWDLC